MTALLLALMLHLPHGHAYGWHHHHVTPPPPPVGWVCHPSPTPPFILICTPPPVVTP